MDGWTDGWLAGWIDGWMDVLIYHIQPHQNGGLGRWIYEYFIPVVPHKAVAEVSKIGNL